jgi:hypothetical protein
LACSQFGAPFDLELDLFFIFGLAGNVKITKIGGLSNVYALTRPGSVGRQKRQEKLPSSAGATAAHPKWKTRICGRGFPLLPLQLPSAPVASASGDA